jgi:protein-disulfide isomerase
MHDQLFANHSWAQTGKDPSRLFRDLAQRVGLDLARYDACMKSGRFAARIEYSRQEGLNRIVDGTPTFYLNGTKLETSRRLPGSDDFKRWADSVIARTPRAPRTTSPEHH